MTDDMTDEQAVKVAAGLGPLVEAQERLDAAARRLLGVYRHGMPLGAYCLSCEREDGARFDRDQWDREVVRDA